MTAKEETIRHMVSRLRRIINRHVRIQKLPIRVGESLVLLPGEVQFVEAIGWNAGMNINALGQALGVTRSASSQMVRKLEKKGLVEKRAMAGNNKEAHVYLTRVGQEAFDAHREFNERHFVTLLHRLDDFSDTQLATAASVLAAFEGGMDDRMQELFGE